MPAHTGIWGTKQQTEWPRRQPNNIQELRRSERHTTKDIPVTKNAKDLGHEAGKIRMEKQLEKKTRGRTTYNNTPNPARKVLRIHDGLKKLLTALLVQIHPKKIRLKEFLWRGRPQNSTTSDVAAAKG